MGKRILFIESDQAISEAVNGMLEGAGHHPHIVTDGAGALEVFSRSPSAFDLIVMDVGLPDISGLRLAERLFGVRADVPIVLLAGEEGQTQSRERNSGIRYFGMKPLSIADLAQTVEKPLTGAA